MRHDSDLIWGEGPKALILVDHHGEDIGDQYSVPVDGYVLDLAYLGIDVKRPDEITAIYQAPNGNRVRSSAVWPWMFVNYGDDHAGGTCVLGHTFWVTATGDGGTLKAWATVSTEPAGGREDGNWEHGFAVKGEEWSPLSTGHPARRLGPFPVGRWLQQHPSCWHHYGRCGCGSRHGIRRFGSPLAGIRDG